MRAAVEPGRVELAGVEVGRDAAVRGHRPRAVLRHERDDRAGTALDDRPANLDSVALEPASSDPAGLVVGALADEARLPAELGHPRRHVRGLAARPELRDRVRVRALGERLAQPDDHVQQQVAERDDHRVPSSHGPGASAAAPAHHDPSWSAPPSVRQRRSPPRAGCARRNASARRRQGSLRSRRRPATASSSRASARRRSRVAPERRARSSAG